MNFEQKSWDFEKLERLEQDILINNCLKEGNIYEHSCYNIKTTTNVIKNVPLSIRTRTKTKEVYTKIPEVLKIDQTLSSTGIQISKQYYTLPNKLKTHQRI